MKKRIYGHFIILILLCMLCLSLSVILIFYNAAKNQEIDAIRDRAKLIAELINANFEKEADYIDFISGEAGLTRLTVIAPDGTVLLDSLTDAGVLENHADRAEFIGALTSGSGEAARYSDTSKSETYYYAVRLDNGNILRVSRPLRGIASAFTAVLPAVLVITALVLILSNLVARRLTDNIVKPLNEIDLTGLDGGDAVVYDELTPYIKKIEKQKSEIETQINELKNRADTIDAISENMKEGLLLTARSGAILKANKSVSAIFGEHEIIGANILHVCRETDFTNAVKRCLAGENAEFSFTRNDKTYSVFFNPSRSNGDIDGAIILFFDSTEKALAEKQRREFTANVSHELKTPLTTILGLSELIENGMAKEKDIAGFAGKISAQTRRLIDIISDIIKLSELDEGARGTREIFDIRALAESVIADLSGKAAEKNVQIKLTGDKGQIAAEKLMIDEMLYNLIDNAIKYNVDGGRITIDLSVNSGLCVVSVTDTGIGIPEEHQSRVFERFYRADKSRSKKTGGTGLGLSIVKHIAEMHGGGAELTSEVGKGTTVTCRIKGIAST